MSGTVARNSRTMRRPDSAKGSLTVSMRYRRQWLAQRSWQAIFIGNFVVLLQEPRATAVSQNPEFAQDSDMSGFVLRQQPVPVELEGGRW